MMELLNATRLGDKFVSIKNRQKKVIVFDKKSANILFQDVKSKKIKKLYIKDFCKEYERAC